MDGLLVIWITVGLAATGLLVDQQAMLWLLIAIPVFGLFRALFGLWRVWQDFKKEHPR